MNFTKVVMKVKVATIDIKIREILGIMSYLVRWIIMKFQNYFVFKMVLAHVYGTVMKSNKCKLMHKLKRNVLIVLAASVDVCLVNGMLMIQSLESVAPTYGGIAKIIQRIFNKLWGIATWEIITVIPDERMEELSLCFHVTPPNILWAGQTGLPLKRSHWSCCVRKSWSSWGTQLILCITSSAYWTH